MQPSESRYGQVWTYYIPELGGTTAPFMLVAPHPKWFSATGVWIVVWLDSGSIGDMSGIDIRPGYPLPAYTYVEG